MARPVSEGLPYFPLDVALDEKFELIEAEFGLTGFAVVIKLLQRIYANGYYCKWNHEVALLFTKSIGLGGNAVSSVINNGVSCLSAGGHDVPQKNGVVSLFSGGGIVPEILRASINRGIFDKTMFEKYSILTSKGIQERYLEATKRRKLVKIEKAYLLVSGDNFSDNVYINSENVCNNSKNVDINSQRKGKESNISCSNSPDGERNEKKVKKVFPKDSDPYKAAKYIADKIAKHTPNYPHIKPAVLEKNLQNWAAHIDSLLRLDGVDFDEFKLVLQFSQTDPFWQTNIMSGKKLRMQYGQLLAKVNAKMNGD